MKAYTSLEQSKKLAEILPIESADQIWARIAIAGANLNVPEEQQYRHNGDMSFQYYSGIGIPCWSLTALLNVLPYPSLHKTFSGWRCDSYNKEGTSCILGEPLDNPIDACYELVLKLREQQGEQKYAPQNRWKPNGTNTTSGTSNWPNYLKKDSHGL